MNTSKNSQRFKNFNHLKMMALTAYRMLLTHLMPEQRPKTNQKKTSKSRVQEVLAVSGLSDTNHTKT